ncbi:glycosyltransferase family 4 protein [Rouxiella chamberiensis]|uniref:Glycosyltransferase family 1 protein n=1 Tax=Rouxiella chamberiensis TaxID=1513468 RepID=A0ABY7HT78_9GAMM|nr:glycosyltransferase family 1 protein [Rouxiella chamberiensis]WAT02187.1 glycosyltransferase family 1 protein [Rouxiella chamberiensis]
MLKIILSTDCVKFPLTGIGRYAFELAKQLENSQSVDLSYLNGLSITKTLPVASETGNSGQGLKRQLQKSRLVSDIYRVTYPYAKSYVLKKQQEHIFHSPNYYIPPNIGKSVATFHDLSVFHWPEFHPAGRVHLMQKELKKTVARAKVLITDSEYTKTELVEYFCLDASDVVVAPLASSGFFMPRQPADVHSVLNKYKLGYKQFFLYTGTIEPRKNILSLLQAYDRLDAVTKRNFPLVISGYKGWENEELFKLFKKGSDEGWLNYLGFTASEDLPKLYAAAKGFLFPSIYEGFGLPVLEAMASGVPVICSNASSLPEVVGEAALMHDPYDVPRFSESIDRLIQDPSIEQRMITAGIERASQFSWKHCADKTIQAYHQVSERYD